ncbi:MAG: AAA family ATPase [Promethearchaeota archaeon]
MSKIKSKKQNDIPWVEKYRPKSSKDMAGFNAIILKLRAFLENFFQLQLEIKQLQKNLRRTTEAIEKKKLNLKIKSAQTKLAKNRAKILLGPPGIGKTTIVYALANDFNLSVIELNASDARTEDALNTRLKETVKSGNLLSFTQNEIKKKLILIDEVDGLHGQSDKGGVATIVKIIGYSKFPIIMTCNFRNDKRFKSLYQVAPIIEIPLTKPADVAQVLTKISTAEDITITPRQIKQIAIRSNGDFRSAINDLQGLTQGTGNIDDETLISINMQRDSEINIQEFLLKMFKTDSIKGAKAVLDKVQGKIIDYRTVNKWINENILNYITRKADLMYAYDYLAYSDRILGYIGRTQDYKHLSYFYDLLSGGIRFAKSDKVLPKTKIQPPRWFRTRAVPDDPISLSLQKLYYQPLNTVMQEIQPNLILFLKYNKKIREYLSQIIKAEPKLFKKAFPLK